MTEAWKVRFHYNLMLTHHYIIRHQEFSTDIYYEIKGNQLLLGQVLSLLGIFSYGVSEVRFQIYQKTCKKVKSQQITALQLKQFKVFKLLQEVMYFQ